MKFYLNLFVHLFISLCLVVGPSFAQTIDGPEDLVVYEVNLRAFSEQGDLASVTNRLGEIQELGANTIWLMPIHPIGIINRVGALGSPYSVRNYGEVSKEYGVLQDLKDLVEQAHQRNMLVMMDWVANHTAWDHPWIFSNPEWYTQDEQGNIVHPAGTNWFDVADLNYDNHQMRAAMVAEMKYWIEEVGIDGYRCDTADFIPFDFWQTAIPALRACTTKRLFMLAEGARPDNYTAGFDMTFGWGFYNSLKSVFNNSVSANQIWASHQGEYAVVPSGSTVLRFTTNHDETAWDAPPPVLFGSLEASQAAYAITVLFGGTPLVYTGQEIGWEQNTPFFDKDPIDWSFGQQTRVWYQNLLQARQVQQAIRKGTLGNYGDENVVVVERQYQGRRVLGIVNTRNSNATVQIPENLRGRWLDLYLPNPTELSKTMNLKPYEIVLLRSPAIVPRFQGSTGG